MLILSAPSGCGKSTLAKMLTESHSDLIERCITTTTRAPRGSEKNGIDYYFLTNSEFNDAASSGEFIEFASVYENLYGTGLNEVKRINDSNKIALLVIDVQGHTTIKEKKPDVRSIFILPPTIEELWKRLTERDTDDLPTQYKRLNEAKNEISLAKTYGYYLINDQLNDTFNQLVDITVNNSACLLTRDQAYLHIESLLVEFNTAEWIKEIRAKIAHL